MVRVSVCRAGDPGFDPRFSRSSPIRDFKAWNSIGYSGSRIYSATFGPVTTCIAHHPLGGVVVRVAVCRAGDPGFAPRFHLSSPTRDSNDRNTSWLLCQAPGVIGPVLLLVGPGVSILWQCEIADLICNFYLIRGSIISRGFPTRMVYLDYISL